MNKSKTQTESRLLTLVNEKAEDANGFKVNGMFYFINKYQYLKYAEVLKLKGFMVKPFPAPETPVNREMEERCFSILREIDSITSNMALAGSIKMAKRQEKFDLLADVCNYQLA